MQRGTQEAPAHSVLNPRAASGAGGKGKKLSGQAKGQKHEGKGVSDTSLVLEKSLETSTILPSDGDVKSPAPAGCPSGPQTFLS